MINECIDNLEQQISWIEDIDAHKFPGWGHTVNAMKQAVALLKVQEPINPHMIDFGIYECPKCRTRVDMTYKYCKTCGKEIKWYDNKGKRIIQRNRAF